MKPLLLIGFSLVAALGCSSWEDTSDGVAGQGGSSGMPGSGGSGNACSLPEFAARPLPRGLHAVGNQLQDVAGAPVLLHGVNRSGSEYACINGQGFFDGPTDDAAIRAMLTWNVNAVRIPLNESCWLGINKAPPTFSGQAYKDAIKSFASRLEGFGLVPVLELHWAAPGDLSASKLFPMPNADHSPSFWRDVASTFVDDDGVVFELYNEPFPHNNQNTEAAWQCWRDGCTHPQIKWGQTVAFESYEAAGMQELVSAVREVGAKQLILLGGVQYSNSVSRWLEYAPQDPLANLAAAWHVYNFNRCSNATCWSNEPGVVSAQVPLLATEIGQDDCQATMVNPLMQFLDEHQSSYLAWWWNTSPGDCAPAMSDNHGAGPPLSLITDYRCPMPKSAFGQAIYDHLTELP